MKKFSLLIVLFISILAITAGCNNQTFDGNRTSNDKQFILDYSVLNKTMTHEMELEKGTVIDVNIKDESGRVDILVTNSGDKEIYRGNDASSCNFSIEVPETGKYKFSVTGSKAKGGVSFIAQ
jgi:hypothetical protein